MKDPSFVSRARGNRATLTEASTLASSFRGSQRSLSYTCDEHLYILFYKASTVWLRVDWFVIRPFLSHYATEVYLPWPSLKGRVGGRGCMSSDDPISTPFFAPGSIAKDGLFLLCGGIRAVRGWASQIYMEFLARRIRKIA